MKDKLFSWIDNSIDLAIDLQTGLTKHPAISPESDGEGELDKCLFLESWLTSHGITKLERFDAPDPRAKGGLRPNLIATIDGNSNEKEGKLWIMSHIDVVPPGDEKLWNSNPWTVVIDKDFPLGVRLIGRGVEDNQQGMVSSVLTALAFIKQGLKPHRTIKLLFSADEEVGSVYGIDWIIKNHQDLFNKNDMVLIPDGGDLKGECIEIAEKNIYWVRFNIIGKQAHGARPDEGANAFLAGCDLALRLHNELSAKFNDINKMFDPNYSTFQPTKKEANVPNINTIPGEDVFYMDMRILPHYSKESVFSCIENIINDIQNKYHITANYTLIQSTQSIPTSADSAIVKELSAAASEIYNVSTHPIGIGGGTMAAFLRNIGIDCAVWTKTQKSLHQPNEYVLLNDIIGDAKVFAILASNK